MCIVCKDWEAGKLTNKEALQNIGELFNTDGDLGNEHFAEVIERIMDKEVPFPDSDEELDKSWHDEIHGHGD